MEFIACASKTIFIVGSILQIPFYVWVYLARRVGFTTPYHAQNSCIA